MNRFSQYAELPMTSEIFAVFPPQLDFANDPLSEVKAATITTVTAMVKHLKHVPRKYVV